MIEGAGLSKVHMVRYFDGKEGGRGADILL